jgi:hypothetical protein
LIQGKKGRSDRGLREKGFFPLLGQVEVKGRKKKNRRVFFPQIHYSLSFIKRNGERVKENV